MKPILLLLTLGLLAGCSQKEEPKASAAEPALPKGRVVLPADSPKLQQIKVAAVEEAQVPTDEVTASGRIEANPTRLSRVLLPVTGRITEVLVRLGDAVREGQPLLTLASPDADTAMSNYLQAGPALAQARAARTKAQADLDRARDLFEHNAVARKEVLNAESAFAAANANVEQADAVLKQAQRKLELLGLKPGDFQQKVVIRAPISGKVLELNVAPGEYRSDPNAVLMSIADLRTVWVSSDVPESYIRFVQTGEPVDVELSAYPGQVFHARVARIADTVDPQSRTVKVRAELDNPEGRFKPEMFGRIRHIESTERHPVVPAGAVIQGDPQNTVYVELSRGVFQETPVKTGKRDGDRIPILQGVKAGDRVVVDGVMLLR